jgi:hypothetical protein
MKKWLKMKNIFILLLLVGIVTNAAVASDSTYVVKQFMQQVQQAYRSANFLSFHVLYRYANKNEPESYLDTMSGEVAMNSSHLRFLLEDVETVTNDQYTIQVHKSEKLIYVTTPQRSQLIDPVAALDSAISHFDGLAARVTRNAGVATLNMTFPPGQAYKQVAMTIDEHTGYLQKVVYEMYTQGLVEKDQLMEGGSGGPYQSEGRIEIVFSQYRLGQFTENLFNDGQYFTRLGQGKYEPTEKYKDYQVFLASTKL